MKTKNIPIKSMVLKQSLVHQCKKFGVVVRLATEDVDCETACSPCEIYEDVEAIVLLHGCLLSILYNGLSLHCSEPHAVVVKVTENPDMECGFY